MTFLWRTSNTPGVTGLSQREIVGYLVTLKGPKKSPLSVYSNQAWRRLSQVRWRNYKDKQDNHSVDKQEWPTTFPTPFALKKVSPALGSRLPSFPYYQPLHKLSSPPWFWGEKQKALAWEAGNLPNTNLLLTSGGKKITLVIWVLFSSSIKWGW